MINLIANYDFYFFKTKARPITMKSHKWEGLGQFANLRGEGGGSAIKRRMVFLMGGGVDTPMHTMGGNRRLFTILLIVAGGF